MKMKSWKYRVTEVEKTGSNIVVNVEFRKFYIFLLSISAFFQVVFNYKKYSDALDH